MNRPSSAFWKDKKVLITGHTGFKGTWLALWLNKLGAEVAGLALPPATTPNLYQLTGLEEDIQSHIADIRNPEEISNSLRDSQPEILFHLAAQSLVRPGYKNPVDTFASNVMGSVHVLDAARDRSSLKVIVMVTTDKVYHNREWLHAYRESDRLGGRDPYSASKAASEIVISSYRDSFLQEHEIAVASARSGNVIGGGDWSVDRLIPDAVRAWQKGEAVRLRNPDATRPWQHVLEPLNGYLQLAERLWDRPDLAGAYNFGPNLTETATVRSVLENARQAYGAGETVFETPPNDALHEAGRLALESSKAQALLGLMPVWRLEEALERTMSWYRAQYHGSDARSLCEADITQFEGCT